MRFLGRLRLGKAIFALPGSKMYSNGADPCASGNIKKGLILGVYEGCKVGEYKLTAAGAKMDAETGGKITDLLKGSGLKYGKVTTFNNLSPEFFAVTLACAGQESLGLNENEVLNECKEAIRAAVGAGVLELEKAGANHISVDPFTCAEAAAEAASLAIWKWQDLRQDRIPDIKVDLYDDPDTEGWFRGIQKGEGQNIARRLSEIPANLMTPMAFAQAALEILCPCGVHVDIRDKEWLEEKKFMNLLTLARGSCEPPLFLELSYCGGGEGDKPVVMTAPGITFCSGGLSLRKCKGMKEMKADMAGAAVLVGLVKTLAVLGAPINVNCLIPLMENMPGGASIKPGDVVVGMNNKTIRVEKVTNEGRVVAADALVYAQNYNPCLTINVGTMTREIRGALGSSATGTFTESEPVWKELARAGADTGDRVWRMPLWNFFGHRVRGFDGVDVHNVGRGRGATPCIAAAFLREFAPNADFVNMDITGTAMEASGEPVYLRRGFMSGRPTRTLFQFLTQMACPLDKPAAC